MNPEAGQPAPIFNLPSDGDLTLSLQDFKGKNVVLYFYPKDDTPGCTLESCGFRDHYVDFQNLNTEIIGISKDSVSSHRRFKEKYDLPFPLLADADGKICESYGVIGEKQMYGKTYRGIIRSTFLIDPQGIIQHIWRNVKVGGHIAAVLNALKERPMQ
jgi:peroxiredoxin Q/BCP